MKVLIRMAQNISHAVMSQRFEPSDSPDDFPTPPWATRALLETVLNKHLSNFQNMSCLEPACGAGHMSRVLSHYFKDVYSSDAFDYGYAVKRDFLTDSFEPNSVDWVITNPPFKLAEEFVLRSMNISRHGVAILARTVFLESVGRYNSIFQNHPPSIFAQFVERVPMVKGRLDGKASTATGYAWFIWVKNEPNTAQLAWVPPCRRQLERAGDYDNRMQSIKIR